MYIHTLFFSSEFVFSLLEFISESMFPAMDYVIFGALAAHFWKKAETTTSSTNHCFYIFPKVLYIFSY